MTGKSFSVWLNNEYIPNNPEKVWMKEAYSKAVKKSIEDGCTAFTRFFKHQSAFPNFKKKGKSDVKMYFVKNNPKDCTHFRLGTHERKRLYTNNERRMENQKRYSIHQSRQILCVSSCGNSRR